MCECRISQAYMAKLLLALAGVPKFLAILLFLCSSGHVSAERSGKLDDGFNYNHTLAQIMVEYASVGFQLVELIVDLQHCLQAFVGVAEDLHGIVIAFRGTQKNSIQNWMEDLYYRRLDLRYPGVKGAMVHRGFYTAYHNTTLRPRIVTTVLGILESINGLSVYVTGHSMGGALAAFCSLDLVANHGIQNIRTVTFGQPRIGNIVFAEFFNSLVPQTYRMTHEHDMVPHLPPYYSLFPHRSFHHFGREVWIHKVENESQSYDVETVCDGSGEDPTCSRSVAGNSIPDHLCYMGLSLQADTWSPCSFILTNNENMTIETEDGFIIKMPLLLEAQAEVQDPNGPQLF
ncbi:hypothetical protein KP509_25G041800 [Ceratopteris richardii]|uniref:Fungal lipase-type domain-containing protein n=2 Tax=Ceratopteris richardii TaxID=49495 RepID=A0A8T2RPQ2_CERRI|nr:hypothetical protein KP509_25G041800 [Ceratopteris richardii]